MPNDANSRMEKTIAALKEDFKSLRSGRASGSILDKIKIDYYGTPTPLNQAASVSVPEARTIVVQPFDKSVLGVIEKAIQKADLGLNPSNDGKVIRISVPPLTADRRKELAKQAKDIAENYRVSIRNIRRDEAADFKKQQKDGTLTEDGLKTAEADLQKATDKYIQEINKILEDKDKEIMEG
ncbi:MAG: ribosome recycling factor [Treponemataceae bacterium]|nr:MAG: ribosome recycling factor [Treponemataceae bacterium]